MGMQIGKDLVGDTPLQPRGKNDVVPLLGTQKQYLREIIQHSRQNARICAASLRLKGNLDVGLLRESIALLVQRHESLRMRIVDMNDMPRQRIDAACDRYLTVVDVTSANDVEMEAQRVAKEFIDESVDLSVGPLFEARLIRLSPAEHSIVLMIDHIVSDGRSCAILNSELWTLYNEAVLRQVSSLAPLPVQFPDYAVWLDQTNSVWKCQHGRYWEDRLSGAPFTDIPIDSGMPELTCPVGVMHHIAFGGELSRDLSLLAGRETTSLPMMMLTIYATLMSRWCERDELVVAFVTHGRHRPELEGMLGLLAHKLYLRICVNPNDTLLDLLKQVELERSAARAHAHDGRLMYDCSTNLVFNWLPLRRGQAAEDGRNTMAGGLQIAPYPARPMWRNRILAFFSETVAGIGVTVHYQPDKFMPGTVRRFGTNLRLLAQEFIRCPAKRLGSISIPSMRN